MRVDDYIVYHYVDEYNTTSTYIQATSARQAVDSIGIPDEDVIEVAKVIKDWKKSTTRNTYTLMNEDGQMVAYKATNKDNAIARAKRAYGGEWKEVKR